MAAFIRLRAALVALGVAVGLLVPSLVQAAVVVGFGFGVPWVAPPVYYPPPVYYAPRVYLPPPVYYAPPPPVVYTPPGFVPPGRTPMYGGAVAQACNAGAYRCPMEQPSAPGAACYCRGNDGQRVWGAVN